MVNGSWMAIDASDYRQLFGLAFIQCNSRIGCDALYAKSRARVHQGRHAFDFPSTMLIYTIVNQVECYSPAHKSLYPRYPALPHQKKALFSIAPNSII